MRVAYPLEQPSSGNGRASLAGFAEWKPLSAHAMSCRSCREQHACHAHEEDDEAGSYAGNQVWPEYERPKRHRRRDSCVSTSRPRGCQRPNAGPDTPCAHGCVTNGSPDLVRLSRRVLQHPAGLFRRYMRLSLTFSLPSYIRPSWSVKSKKDGDAATGRL